MKAALRRLVLGAAASVFAVAITAEPVMAATTRKPVPPKPLPVAQPVRATARPLIFQINPAKVNPTVQPNIMILGQYLTPASTVQVGGRPATTVEMPDANHLLVRLPDNLSQGTYLIAVRNEAGTTIASDPLVVDNSGQQPKTMNYLMVGGGPPF